ncbi:hypothetical protein AB0D45_00450 [Streptomyces sp. NPDC048352]|uniref:hypothetical protein n=1 Tax=Streptomyces sp. NPDC048352 TaxID=3154718 RepID=UPI0034323652
MEAAYLAAIAAFAKAAGIDRLEMSDGGCRQGLPGARARADGFTQTVLLKEAYVRNAARWHRLTPENWTGTPHRRQQRHSLSRTRRWSPHHHAHRPFVYHARTPLAELLLTGGTADG